MLHLLNSTSLHGPSQRFHFLKHCTRVNAFDASVIVISHTACLPAKGLRRNSHQCYISSMLHLFTDSVSVFIFWSIAQESPLSWQVLYSYHTLHVCLQKVCGAILINATSPQCYISSRTQSAFSFFEALRKRERFRHKCYSYITHCMSACKRFAAQFPSMLHLLNATSLHGLSQRFHFLKHCTRENGFDTSVIVISHTACLPAKGLWRNSHQCYISSMLHLFTDSVSLFIFWSIAQERTVRRKCYSYITHCLSLCKRFAAQFSSMLHLLNATSLHGLSQHFHLLKHCTRENAFDASVIVISHTACLPAKGLRRNSHECYISSMLHLFTDSVSVFIFWSIAQERTFSTQVL